MSSERVVVRSDIDNHVLFQSFKAYYKNIKVGAQTYHEHHHSELEISAILAGSGVYTCNDIDYPFSKGDVFIHCGNDLHYFKEIAPGENPALVVLRFEPRFIWSPGGGRFDSKYLLLFMTNKVISRSISHNISTANTVLHLLEEIFDECKNQLPAYDLMVKANLMTILASIVRCFQVDKSTITQASIDIQHLNQIEQSMDYILSHLSDPLTVEQLAKESFMSYSYYSTTFKALNGISVWEYVISQRIDRAQYLLENCKKPITEISEDCGFNNIANFNRSFKKATGTSPREYRKNIGETRNHQIRFSTLL